MAPMHWTGVMAIHGILLSGQSMSACAGFPKKVPTWVSLRNVAWLCNMLLLLGHGDGHGEPCGYTISNVLPFLPFFHLYQHAGTT